MAEKRVRWGILGAGLIAHRFARSLVHDPASELVAISCRSATKAAAFAEEHGVAADRAYVDDAGAAATPRAEHLPASSGRRLFSPANSYSNGSRCLFL